MSTNIIMPQLGESVVDGTLAEWLKKPGDSIAEFEPIVRVSTDKVDTEIPSPGSGVLLEVFVAEGQTVNAGTVLGVIGSAANGQQAPQAVKPQHETSSGQHLTPVVARMLQHHGIRAEDIAGTGRNGRITKKDVETFLAGRGEAPAAAEELAPWEQPGSGDLFKPTVEYASPAQPPAPKPPAPAPAAPAIPRPAGLPHELIAISSTRRRIAQHMVESKHTSPHVTTVFEADLSAVVRHREANRAAFEAQGIRLTYTPYFVMATTQALQRHPALNARWTEEGILQFRVVNIGIATATPDGLLVPVLKNAQDYNLVGLARQVNDLAERARSRQLRPDDMTDGTFTITNHGVSGSLFATPIINQPQAAILGIGALEKRVKVIDDAIAIRPCAYLSLTFDHRLFDGAEADTFMADLKQILEKGF
jgi:2-oxoglutarate dehydrogenase E2 component (dihydrolipoamide succinyltransferase)